MKKPITTLAVLLLALMALLHLLRLIFPVEIMVGGSVVPQWASIIGCLMPGGLAIGLHEESKR